MTNKTREQTLKNKITQLENQKAIKKAQFDKATTKENLAGLKVISGEIADYQRRLEIETKLRDYYWNDLKYMVTPEEFSNLWENRLAVEATSNKLEEIRNLKQSLSFLS